MMNGTIRILPYEEKYRDDMIFMVLQAKDALGRVPRLNDDLLTVRQSYLDQGDCIWLAVDESGRVAGCVGYHAIPGTDEAMLHRLYVKPALKRQGIGTALLQTAEDALRQKGFSAVRVHLGAPKEQWFESYAFYPKHGYVEEKPRFMKKELR